MLPVAEVTERGRVVAMSSGGRKDANGGKFSGVWAPGKRVGTWKSSKFSAMHQATSPSTSYRSGWRRGWGFNVQFTALAACHTFKYDITDS